MELRTSDQCDGARIHEEVLGDHPSEDDSGDEKYDNDLKLLQLVLEEVSNIRV